MTDDTQDQAANHLGPPKNPAAVALGRLGGLSRSPRKIEAVKRNAVKGGRPRKPKPSPSVNPPTQETK